jgi:hypothetical protein
VLAAGNQPDFRTIADFRKRHLTALSGFFEQVLRRNSSGGLVLFVLILYALVNDARAKEAIATGRTLARLA